VKITSEYLGDRIWEDGTPYGEPNERSNQAPRTPTNQTVAR
jgi:hypothetical protein